MTILIVDDDKTTMRALDGLLRKEGFETRCAYDIAEAERCVTSESFSLILLDVHLPDGNGLDFCTRLQSSRDIDNPPVLIISAVNDLSVKVKGFAAGAVDYITKPLAGAEVMARVRTHLRLKAAYESLARMHEERVSQLSTSQAALMPRAEDFPDARFEVFIRQNHQAGGDFYDVIASGRHVFDYIVADAAGHDLGASLWTAAFKALLSEHATALHTPAELFRLVNRSLVRILPEHGYFTAIYARLNRAGNRLTLVNAGHPCAVLMSGQTREIRLVEQDGDVLGMFSDASFGITEIPVRPGDRVFLYSDGLIEHDGRRDGGMAGFLSWCRQTVDLDLAEAVSMIVQRIFQGAQPDDDVVLLGVQV